MAGITRMHVKVEQIIPSRASAGCTETSTLKTIEVPLLPLRSRVPQVGETWLIDRAFGSWSFAALLASPDLFLNRLTVGEAEPVAPRVGDRWCPQPVQVWDGTDWVDE